MFMTPANSLNVAYGKVCSNALRKDGNMWFYAGTAVSRFYPDVLGVRRSELLVLNLKARLRSKRPPC